MAPRNCKSIIFARNRAGIERAVTREHPSLGVAFGLLNQFLCFTTLSRRNILWAAKHVQTLREHTDWINDISSQEKLDRLDQAVAAAKERLQRRKEKRERIEEAALPKADRKKKSSEPVAPPTPTTDHIDVWDKILDSQRTKP
jgi:hypothetical protein